MVTFIDALYEGEMKYSQAIKLAIIELKRRIKTISFDANMHDLAQATYPAARRASAERKRLKLAIKVLSRSVKKC